MAKMLGLANTPREWKSGADYICCSRHSANGAGKRRSRHRARQIERRALRREIEQQR